MGMKFFKQYLEELRKKDLYRKFRTISSSCENSVMYKGKNFIFLGDQAKIIIVLRNILTNAIESIPKQGKITIRLKAEGNYLSLEIIDTGKDIPKEILKRVFEPYFSTKDVGTGLGLPIAKKIIDDHGGTIDAVKNQPTGIRILISFPIET